MSVHAPYDRGYETGLAAGRVEGMRAFWETYTRINALGTITRPGSDTVWVKRDDALSVLSEESARAGSATASTIGNPMVASRNTYRHGTVKDHR